MSILVPPGVPERIWVVIDMKKSDRHLMFKEPLEGWDAWTKNSSSKVFEYTFHGTVHVSPPSPKKPVPK